VQHGGAVKEELEYRTDRREGGYAGKILDLGNRNPEWYTYLAENFKQILSGRPTGKIRRRKIYRMLNEEDMQTRWSNCGWRIKHHCHSVAKSTRSDRTIYRLPEVKSHQIKEGWFPDKYRKNQNDCQCEGWTIKKIKMLINALQNVERIFHLPTTKRRGFPLLLIYQAYGLPVPL